jgi:hypothetical protein
MSIELLYDAKHRILLIRVSGRGTEEVLAAMQDAARRFVARNGACDGIIDFSAVQEIDVSSQFVARLAQQKAVLSGHRRVIVASKEIVFGLSRMFGAQQDAATGEAPIVVRSLREAYEVFGVHDPAFVPVDDPIQPQA